MRQSFLAWLLLGLAGLQSLAASGSAQWILCWGDDGHVEVEAGADGKCGGPEPSAGEASRLSDADHCGPCWDMAWQAMAVCAPSLPRTAPSFPLPTAWIEWMAAPSLSSPDTRLRSQRELPRFAALRQSSPASVRLLI